MTGSATSGAAPRHRVADDVDALGGVPFVDSLGDEVYLPSRAVRWGCLGAS